MAVLSRGAGSASLSKGAGDFRFNPRYVQISQMNQNCISLEEITLVVGSETVESCTWFCVASLTALSSLPFLLLAFSFLVKKSFIVEPLGFVSFFSGIFSSCSILTATSLLSSFPELALVFALLQSSFPDGLGLGGVG